ncbi:uncharacterized protein METZ01_LOCUS168716 [marine metagenome]|uniref:Uncharacterized protein n=1 Tax=marine metagenome TaxID=408172 RepID=A0A382BR17_9ZZZZ
MTDVSASFLGYETARLIAFRPLDIQDAEPEKRYSRLTRVATATLDVPLPPEIPNNDR